MFCCSFLCPSHGVRRRSSSVCLHHLTAFDWRLALLLHTLGAGSFLPCLAALLGLSSPPSVFEKRVHHAVHRQHAALNMPVCCLQPKNRQRFWGNLPLGEVQIKDPFPPSAFEKRVHHAVPRQHAVVGGWKIELLKAACQWDLGTQ